MLPYHRPHSDTGGHAVVFGINHRAESAQDCCDRCAAHAKNPKNAKRPCNSWVFCPLPICWGLDTGWNHTYGECWLKWQADTSHALYGQRGRYSAEYRARYRSIRTGAPSHVPWTGGVLGTTPDLSVQWTTGIEGMRSSSGAELTNWRYCAAFDVQEPAIAVRLSSPSQCSPCFDVPRCLRAAPGRQPGRMRSALLHADGVTSIETPSLGHD
jgi:hypothetical protein